MLLQFSSNKVLGPWSRENSLSYHLAIVPLTDVAATRTRTANQKKVGLDTLTSCHLEDQNIPLILTLVLLLPRASIVH